MATTKITITVDPEEHRLLIATVNCHINWTTEFIANKNNADDMRRKAQTELPLLKNLKASL